MSTVYYDIYQKKNIKLAESMFIHTPLMADVMNRYLLELGYEVGEDPLTWKYYHNIAGEYHLKDREMTIISHDTLEEIVFSKENLLIHKGTKLDYLTDSNHVKALVNRYPDQQFLIKRILNPIDPVVALESEEGTILYYDKDLVEENEIDLINLVQSTISHFFRRWNVNRHSLIDDLAPASFFAILYRIVIVPAISNVRKSMCLTRQAHSYHIREYLRSYGGLDAYLDILNKKQILYLYKNIRYIRKNAGKQEVMEEIIENLLTSIGIPLSRYVLRHNKSTAVADNGSTSSYFIRAPVNYLDVDRSNDRLSIMDILDKQDKLAVDNKAYKIDEEKFIRSEVVHANSELRTKVLESDMLDVGEGSPYTREKSLIDYWFYLSSIDKYTSYVTIPNPIGTEDISLSVKDCATLALYCAMRSQDIVVDQIPVYNTTLVRRVSMPAWGEVRALAPRTTVSDHFIDMIMHDNMEIEEYSSSIAFRETALHLHDRLQMHRLGVGYFGNPLKAVSMLVATMSLYVSRPIVVGTGTFDEWMASKGIDLSSLGKDDFLLLYDNIVKECISRPDDEKTLADIQKGVIEILSVLSSYNVQFVYDINTSPVIFNDRMNVGPMEYSAILSIRDALLRNQPRYDRVRIGYEFRGSVPVHRQLTVRVEQLPQNYRALVDNSRGVALRTMPELTGTATVDSVRIVGSDLSDIV